jgi:hypothetical protein
MVSQTSNLSPTWWNRADAPSVDEKPFVPAHAGDAKAIAQIETDAPTLTTARRTLFLTIFVPLFAFVES